MTFDLGTPSHRPGDESTIGAFAVAAVGTLPVQRWRFSGRLGVMSMDGRTYGSTTRSAQGLLGVGVGFAVMPKVTIGLESYYDGVAGFSGSAARLAPPIEPGASFEARFTPPRAGTFIYHTHVDEIRQQRAGLTGALLVVDSPASYDAEHDRVFLVTVPRRQADNDRVLLNGSSSPAARDLRVGETYRLRFIDVHTFRPSMRMRMVRGDALLSWRALAKDGMDLPADQATVGPSMIQMGNGETYDFEFRPEAAGDLRFEITTGTGAPLLSMPVRVR